MDGTRLLEIETRLDEVAVTSLSNPPKWPAAACFLGARALTIDRGIRACVAVPASAAVQILLRSLVDLAILVDWIAQDPGRRVVLWEAESERESATYIREAVDLGLIAFLGLDEVEAKRVCDAKMEQVARARQMAGIGPKDRLLPFTDKMAEQLGREERRQLYTGLLRTSSAYTHSSATSFAEMAMLGNSEGPLRNPEEVRKTAVALLARVMGSVSRASGLGIESECDRLLAELVG
jgi:hypothetical protein